MENELDFSHYKLLQKRIDFLEREQENLRDEVSRWRNATSSTRDNVEKITTALLGAEALGVSGIINRLDVIERRLTKVWYMFLATIVIQIFSMLYFMFRLYIIIGMVG